MQSHESGRALGATLCKVLVSSLVLTGTALAAPAASAGEAAGEDGYGKKVVSSEPITEKEAAQLVADFESMIASHAECGEACYAQDECSEECTKQQKKAKHVATMLWKRKGAFKALRPSVVEQFTQRSEVRGAILDFFSWEPSESVAAMASELYEVSPQSFSTDHMISFAYSGAEVFKPELEKRMHKSKDQRERFMAAAFFAENDKAAKKVLAGCLDKPCESDGGVVRAFLAASILEKLGEPSRMAELTDKVSQMALETLDSGDVERARRIAMEASFGRKMSKKMGYFKPAFFDREIEGAIAWGSREKGAQGVFEMIDKLHTL